MLVCAKCGNVIKECCDIYYEAFDKASGTDCAVCGTCQETMVETGEAVWEDEDAERKD